MSASPQLRTHSPEKVVPHTEHKTLPSAVLAIAAFLLLWALVATLGIVPDTLFPPPSRVALALWEWANSASRPVPAWLRSTALGNDLFWDSCVSVRRAAVGWLAGSIAGVAVGIATGRARAVNDYIAPIIQLFRPLPPVAIIPLVIVWFGIGEPSKVFSIAFAVFFPVWINAHLGAQRVPQFFIWSAYSLGASRRRILTRVILPAALPFIIAGLRTGVAVAFVMVFVSELAGASAGLGYEIETQHLAFRVDRMMAALFVLGTFGAVADWALTRALNWLNPWLRYSSRA